MRPRDVVPNGVSLETVDPPFPLLEIDWIPGKIPVVDPIAIGVKIQTFLAYRGRGQNEGSERRIEGIPHASQPDCSAFIILVLSQTHGKPATHPDRRMENNLVVLNPYIIDVDL